MGQRGGIRRAISPSVGTTCGGRVRGGLVQAHFLKFLLRVLYYGTLKILVLMRFNDCLLDRWFERPLAFLFEAFLREWS